MKTDDLKTCKCKMKGYGLKIGKVVDGKWKQKSKKEMLKELDEIEGGSLKPYELKGMLNASYNNKIKDVGDFVLDDTISSKTSRVFVNPYTGQTVVAHQGTKGITDWGNNLAYALGGKKLYKKTGRYKEAKRVQDRAMKKYGKEDITTIGHSQGGLQAEMLGSKGKETITVNKATRPLQNKKSKNQYDIRVEGDVVSSLNPFQRKSKRDIEIEMKGYNPLKHHSYDILDKLKEDIGKS